MISLNPALPENHSVGPVFGMSPERELRGGADYDRRGSA